MAFTRPSPDAVNFTAYPEYLEPGRVRHGFRFPVDVYTPPVASAVEFQSTYYVYPHGGASDFKVFIEPLLPVVAVGAVTLEFFPEGHFYHPTVAVIAHGAATFEFTPEGHAKHGVRGAGAAVLDFVADGHAKHGIRGVGAATFGFTPMGVASHPRHQLVGEVRDSGALVDKRIRVYHRATGVLVGDQDTVAGKFKVHTGFTAEEYYVLPIDMSAEATDWSPPCANRLLSVLVVDGP